MKRNVMQQVWIYVTAKCGNQVGMIYDYAYADLYNLEAIQNNAFLELKITDLL